MKAHQLVNGNTEIVSRIVAETYEAAYDPGKWPVVVDGLRNILHGSRAFPVRVGPDMGPQDSVAAVADPAFQSRASEFWDIAADFIKVSSAVSAGLVYSDNALHGQDRLRASPFWNEWMAPQEMYGGLVCKLFVSHPSFWSLYVHRGRNQEALDSADAELFSFFVPHVRRAVEIGRTLQAKYATSLVASRLPFGMVLVDGFQRIVSMNEAAEAILARPRSPLRSVNGHLAATDRCGNEKLRQLVVEACTLRNDVSPGLGGDFLQATRCQGEPALLSISIGPFRNSGIMPMERCALVAIRELTYDLPEGFSEQIRSLFNLTSREADIAALLAAGVSLKDAAQAANIRISTARSYLEQIFQKTGTKQQSQMVARLKSLSPAIWRL